MKYKSYDELISLVSDFRLEHQNLSANELDRLLKTTFRIDQSILRELDGTSDLMTTPLQNTPSGL